MGKMVIAIIISGITLLGVTFHASRAQQLAPLPPSWQERDCRAAKLNAPGQVRCAIGPPQSAGGGNLCAFEQWAVFTRSAAGEGYGQIFIKGGEPQCHVVGVEPIALLQRGQKASSGTSWSAVTQVGDFHYASFTSGTGEKCKAFGKFQLPYYQVRGWLCASNKDVADADVQGLANSMVVRLTGSSLYQ